MPMTPLSEAPSRSDPENFAARADALLTALPNFVTEANALEVSVNASAVLAQTSAATAVNAPGTSGSSTTSTTIGTGSKTLTTQTGKNFVVGMFVIVAYSTTPSNYMFGQITAYNSGTGSITVNVLSVGGSGTQALWDISLCSPTGPTTIPAPGGNANKFLYTDDGVNLTWKYTGVPYEIRGSNTILGIADIGKWIDITSGTFSQTFTAAATLATGWYVYIKNSGTGLITLDPNGTERCDGLTSFVMYPGEARLIQCDGTNFHSIVLKSFYHTFTASGTFTRPPGYTSFHIRMWGGGGSGRRHTTASIKVGGSGASCVDTVLSTTSVSASQTVTIGAGGTAVTADATNGNDGGTSVFSICSAFGGLGGQATAVRGGSAYITGLNASSNNVYGGVLGGGLYGYLGGTGSSDGSTVPSPTVFGGGSGGGISAADGLLDPVSTLYGGAGGAAVVAGNGVAGTVPGGGGGATKTGTSSGAGAAGQLIIWGIV